MRADTRQAIKHVVVLMMENRSFDHMLGYLSKEGKRTDVAGLSGDGTDWSWLGNEKVPARRLGTTEFKHKVGHGIDDVKRQIEYRTEQGDPPMHGFIADYAIQNDNNLSPDECKADMGYYTGDQVGALDFLAREYMVLDRWHSSIPGPTVPNRLYAMTGDTFGETETTAGKAMLGYDAPDGTFADLLGDSGDDWITPFHDAPSMFYFRKYRSIRYGRNIVPMEQFYERAALGRLPKLTWIDPNFETVPGFLNSVLSNDDHAPGNVSHGEQLIGSVYNALVGGREDAWAKTILVVTYDEHGGFYDHVLPPDAPVDAKRPYLPATYGLRVPAILASPWIARGSCGRPTDSNRVFDHASIARLVLDRFVDPAVATKWMPPRVADAEDLWPLMSDSARAERPHCPVEMPAWRRWLTGDYFRRRRLRRMAQALNPTAVAVSDGDAVAHLLEPMAHQVLKGGFR